MNKHESYRSVAPLGIALVAVVVVLGVVTAQAVAPTGSRAGAVQFDAVFELNSPTRGNHVLLFARYWVGPDFFNASVIWAEPHGRGLTFPIYPPTLSFASDANAFTMSHDLFPVYDTRYAKPLEPRGVFRYMYGDYPIDNIRFAEQEALAQRIYTTDLDRLRDANERGFHSLQANRSEDRIESLRLLGPEKTVLKDIVYEYDVESPGRLRRKTVKLPERPMTVGFQGKGVVVKVGDQEHTYRDFKGTHHAGGRTATVNYEPVTLAGREVALPAKIQVVSEAQGQSLRSVRLLDLKPSALDAAGAKDAARRFGGFSEEHHRYRQFLVKYWKKDTAEVNEVDAEAMRHLRTHFEKAGARVTGSLGEKLRELNILMELNRMLDDETQLERYFAEYLGALRTNDCAQMVLVGGYAAIDTSMLWRRDAEADRLLERWLEEAVATHTPPIILNFAEARVQKGPCWPVVRLLEKSLQCQAWGRARFAGQVLRCAAIEQLVTAARKPDETKSETVQAQTVWVASSLGTDRLVESLGDAVRQAEQSFAALDEPTDEEKTLKARLGSIAKTVGESSDSSS